MDTTNRRSKVLVLALVAAIVLALACATDDASDNSSEGDGNTAATSGGTADSAGGSAEPAAACKDTPDDGELDTMGTALYEGRVDTQAEDHEAAVGDCVRVAGLTGFVEGAAMQASEFGDPQLVVDVRIRNRDDAAKPYNLFDWRIQTSDGQVLDPSIAWSSPNALESGDLITGGEVSGQVAFDVPPGTYFVIWKPDAFNSARGIWQVEVA